MFNQLVGKKGDMAKLRSNLHALYPIIIRLKFLFQHKL